MSTQRKPLGFFTGLVLAFLGSFSAMGLPVGAQQSGTTIVPHKVVLRLAPDVDIAALNRDYVTQVDEHLAGTTVFSLDIPTTADESDFARRLAGDPRVVYAETDVLISGFHGHPFQFAFDGSAQPGGWANQSAFCQVNVGMAHHHTQGEGVTVAILDTGANLGHPALCCHFTQGYNAIDSASEPWDLADGPTNIGAGHGTFIAGIIAQMAPKATIMPVKVLDSEGMGTLFNIIEGLHYAVQHGAQVVNMSFGSSVDLPALADAVREAEEAGVVLVASAGNSGRREKHYPAAYPGVLAVSAVDEDNVKPDFANFGEEVAVVAPGTNIRSTFWTGGYATWSGTSFSTPFVTGQAALLLSLRPDLRLDEVHQLIRGTAVDVIDTNPGFEGLLGDGIIDVEASIFQLL